MTTQSQAPEMKTSIWQSSCAHWVGDLDELEARAQQAKAWLEDHVPEWLDDWSVQGRAEGTTDGSGNVYVFAEFIFDFLTELEHGKHDREGTASEDPKMIHMRELCDYLSNHLDLVGAERFNPKTTGAVYDI